MEASLFEEESLKQPEPHACIECANFAGQKRDKKAWLFRMHKGYCDEPRHHPGGIWAVVQDIVKKHTCSFFKAADPDLIQQRQRALEILK